MSADPQVPEVEGMELETTAEEREAMCGPTGDRWHQALGRDFSRLSAELSRTQQQLGECSGGFETASKEVEALKGELSRLDSEHSARLGEEVHRHGATRVALQNAESELSRLREPVAEGEVAELVERLDKAAFDEANRLCQGVTDPELMIYPGDTLPGDAATLLRRLAQSAEDERARIVAFLRRYRDRDIFAYVGSVQDVARAFADAIARGQHREKKS